MLPVSFSLHVQVETLEKHAEQMQDKCWDRGSTLMVSSVDNLKSYSHNLALKGLREEMKNRPFFFSFVPYMGIILRGCTSFFLLYRFAVNILDQSSLAKCRKLPSDGQHRLAAGFLWCCVKAASWAIPPLLLLLPGEYGWDHSRTCTHRTKELRYTCI